ncbi:MAG: nucleotidyltransferase domain-containing protein [archaeon]
MQKILKEELERVKLSDKELAELKNKTNALVKNIEKVLEKVNAEVFLGGSLAKGTVIKKKVPDVDIFVRFKHEKDISKLGAILKKAKLKTRKIHGSRDYFQVKDKGIVYEIVPVLKIGKPEDAANVTDLSYFHVTYVVNKINKKPELANEIILAKSFTHSSECYGAESYVKGFSGYALELLVINYGGFVNFLKAISKTKGQMILDPEKHYKDKIDVLSNLNEAKLESPIVFIDPTYAERNALAALSVESFEKFKVYSKAFIKKPSKKFFEQPKVDIKRYNLVFEVHTSRQEGDVAGSKLLKFYKVMLREIEKYYGIKDGVFWYDEKKLARYYFQVNPKKERVILGPPVKMKEAVVGFKKVHKKTYIKQGKICSKQKISMTKSKFLSQFKKAKRKQIKDMGIIGIE